MFQMQNVLNQVYQLQSFSLRVHGSKKELVTLLLTVLFVNEQHLKLQSAH